MTITEPPVCRHHEPAGPKRSVLVMTVVHNLYDSRIWFREIDALLRSGWDVTLCGPFSRATASTRQSGMPDFPDRSPPSTSAGAGRRRSRADLGGPETCGCSLMISVARALAALPDRPVRLEIIGDAPEQNSADARQEAGGRASSPGAGSCRVRQLWPASAVRWPASVCSTTCPTSRQVSRRKV